LLPGMYAQVKFNLTRSRPTNLVPGNAVVANAQGTRVATVAPDGRVHFVNVQLGRDLGTEVEVLEGLNGTERLITNPADTLGEGQPVQINESKEKGKKS
jgi:multidrug efflux pump subunit AcrA (membrane-fusion protein)